MAISGRTALGRRVRDLAESFAVMLGGWPALTDMQTAAIRRAAELSALAEQSRAIALRHGCADPVALSRLEGCADRAVRRLGLPQAPREPIGPSLDQYLAANPEVRSS
jgi:hypothetical protein